MVTQATGYGSGSLTTDLNGRQTSLLSADPNDYTLEYTWEGKLAKGTFGSSAYQLECRYSPSGTRIYKKRTWPSDSYEHKYIVDDTGRLPQVLLAVDVTENDPNDAIAKTFIYANNQVIAQHDGFYGDPIYFYLHDRLGSVRELIDSDGDVANCYYYDPWGKTGGETDETVDNFFTFAGYWYDPEVDLFYCNARMYDPTLARFTSRDPYSGSFDSPMELHRYLYCMNDPMNRIDPSGEYFFTIAAIVLRSTIDTMLRDIDTKYSLMAYVYAGTVIVDSICAYFTYQWISDMVRENAAESQHDRTRMHPQNQENIDETLDDFVESFDSRNR